MRRKSSVAASDCFVCRKQRGLVNIPGGVIHRDDLTYASHSALPEKGGPSYLGTLFVEPLRHVAGLADLDDAEAQRLGLVAARLARALRATEGAEHCYLHVLGHHVPHLHLWVVPRYPGTPSEYWGLNVGKWPGAPRGGVQEIQGLCDRVRDYLRRTA